MAEGKKGFILYTDIIFTVKQLSDTKAGKLFKHILKYVNDENPNSHDQIINLVFEPIKQQLRRDLLHWELIRVKRSESGKMGGRPKKQIEAKKANASFDKQKKQSKAKKAVIVNVKDNVKVNVTDIINGFDFNYKIELANYIKHLQEKNRDIGYMQVEQMIKMLDSWYNNKSKKVLCLSQNIANNWKTLNFVEIKAEDNDKKAWPI